MTTTLLVRMFGLRTVGSENMESPLCYLCSHSKFNPKIQAKIEKSQNILWIFTNFSKPFEKLFILHSRHPRISSLHIIHIYAESRHCPYDSEVKVLSIGYIEASRQQYLYNLILHQRKRLKHEQPISSLCLPTAGTTYLLSKPQFSLKTFSTQNGMRGL